MKSIQSFLSKPRKTLFRELIEWEIFHRVFPHVRNEKDHGYPFGSEQEFREQSVRSSLDGRRLIEALEADIAKMPEAYGASFRYLMYRDLNARLKMYQELSQRRIQPETCDPRLVATCAE